MLSVDNGLANGKTEARMKDQFKDVLGIDGVHGVIWLNESGSLSFYQFKPEYRSDEETVKTMDWSLVINELSDITEAEMMFDAGRVYFRKGGTGFLIVVLDDHAPVSMVRLNCEVLMPTLDKQKSGKGFGQLLRKKIF